ncbi:MAG: hypothetical protein N0C84_16995 [Candidatus Thiodiazotropha taylori]|uniref:Uncharacterized protein n=1 Tax=Candidatus Thiodiazotropha taylori TaxID=2792791 RepID=A0A9E4N5Y2_9GAMM|nr:hypothetical protein [Candidatus Thiodiazotropha taylori]MCW4258164.1 hypothetical protein [Candidatus Thiodiazotropha taylori]
MVEQIASFIQRYQIKRIALLVFMMWLTRDVYDWAMTTPDVPEWKVLALTGPLTIMFPAVIAYMQEEQ